ncbi:PREDICTED: uncharacterized protein LOC106749362 [Dinoponera quadriceps]|uniref:Odorant receptor n=1 Tax=Dinoponera quadriceps TaxID=609295 RepID=A0A6P3Y257_DINQU|nr:PREDICTED: uncharacterized protein LOC106749362 [Dinoponera quadriceps]
MFPNKNYESDIKYTIELNRFICRLLGIWPSMNVKTLLTENLRNTLLILICYVLLCSELIPTVLYAIIIEKRTRNRLKHISSIMFTTVAVFKYCNLVFSRNRVRNCLMRVQEDWQNVASTNARDSMLDSVKISRHLIILCGIFMYTAGLYFRIVVPLSRGKSVTDQNITIRYLPCPTYYVFFDGRISPAYEIMFFMQFFSGLVKYTITVSICSLAALFIMHVCAQLEILMMLMDNLVKEQEVKNLNKMLALTVEYQIKTRSFLQLVQNTLEYTSLLELLGCTLMEWEDQNVISMSSYLILLTSITFNIFIFCFIGEQLSIEGEKLSLTVCTLDWYHFPYDKARALILIVAMSNKPIKFQAGKFVDLTIRTFGDVVKTSVAYMNLIRKVMD